MNSQTFGICTQLAYSFHSRSTLPHIKHLNRFLRSLTLRPSEFVAQGKLHYAWLGQQAGVGSEAAGRLRQRSEQGCSYALGVEAREIRNVEHFPSKLQIVGFPVWHFPPFCQ